LIFDERFSVAPMMDWTDQHCRYFHRLISQQSILYTEMISADAIIYGPRHKLLSFNNEELPCVIQLGGNNPQKLADASNYAQDYGYSSINLNIGCPSNRVKNGAFGACLMKTPKLVASCVNSIKNNCHLPVTIKCRIGIDDMDEIQGLDEFIDEVSESGVIKFIVHARKAILNGLSPKQNREIPPLNYERVAFLKRRRPDLQIILNGGIESLNQGKNLIKEHHLDGFMIGREAYKNPYILASVDKEIFEKKTIMKTRYQIVIEMVNYIDMCIKKDDIRVNAITRHMLGLYNCLPGAKEWRRTLSEDTRLANNSDILKFATDRIEEVIQSKNVA